MLFPKQVDSKQCFITNAPVFSLAYIQYFSIATLVALAAVLDGFVRSGR